MPPRSPDNERGPRGPPRRCRRTHQWRGRPSKDARRLRPEPSRRSERAGYRDHAKARAPRFWGLCIAARARCPRRLGPQQLSRLKSLAVLAVGLRPETDRGGASCAARRGSRRVRPRPRRRWARYRQVGDDRGAGLLAAGAGRRSRRHRRSLVHARGCAIWWRVSTARSPRAASRAGRSRSAACTRSRCVR
jgi:hypothetical protein